MILAAVRVGTVRTCTGGIKLALGMDIEALVTKPTVREISVNRVRYTLFYLSIMVMLCFYIRTL